jgi:hypothetical protein
LRSFRMTRLFPIAFALRAPLLDIRVT